MFYQYFRKYAFWALIGIWINSYIKAEQPNLGDLNLTAESQLIYYPTESGTSQIYWSDLSETIQDLNLTGDPSSFNEDTKYLITKNFLKNQVPSAFEKLDTNHYTWSEYITEKRNEIIKAIYSEEWFNISQEAGGNGQSNAWQDFLLDTENYNIFHNSVFATQVFEITDQTIQLNHIPPAGFISVGFMAMKHFPYFYDSTTEQWVQFLQMEERYGFLHAKLCFLSRLTLLR